MVKSAARKHLSFLAWKLLGFLRAGDTLIANHASGSGQVIKASLLDAGETATELELLRTVASGLGIVWAQDDLGAWAVVPNEPRSTFATQAEAEPAELALAGHKQRYFVELNRQTRE